MMKQTKYFKNFSNLISDKINIDRYNSYKKHFGGFSQVQRTLTLRVKLENHWFRINK